jgi:hypothetical protein
MKRIHPVLKALVVLTVMLGVTTVVNAAATFGGSTGPTFINPGYRFTAQVIAISSPQSHVCLSYTVNNETKNPIACNCALPVCNPATRIGWWECIAPDIRDNGSISWDISAYAGSSCIDYKVQGPTGMFIATPNALTTAALTAQVHSSASGATLAGLLIVAACFLGAGWWMLRRRTAA